MTEYEMAKDLLNLEIRVQRIEGILEKILAPPEEETKNESKPNSPTGTAI